MKCFYHENKDAVGQCRNCGKGLCKECVINNNGICKDCYFDSKAENIDTTHENIFVALTNYKKSIIKSLVLGGIFGVIFEIFLVGLCQVPTSEFFGLLLFFFIPSGYMTLTKVFGKDPNAGAKNTVALFGLGSQNEAAQGFAIGYFLAKIIGFAIKVVISFFIGIPCVIYLIVKLVMTNKQLKQLEVDYKNEVDNFVDEMNNSKK